MDTPSQATNVTDGQTDDIFIAIPRYAATHVHDLRGKKMGFCPLFIFAAPKEGTNCTYLTPTAESHRSEKLPDCSLNDV